MKCEKCGKDVKGNSKYCMYCGCEIKIQENVENADKNDNYSNAEMIIGIIESVISLFMAFKILKKFGILFSSTNIFLYFIDLLYAFILSFSILGVPLLIIGLFLPIYVNKEGKFCKTTIRGLLIGIPCSIVLGIVSYAAIRNAWFGIILFTVLGLVGWIQDKFKEK